MKALVLAAGHGTRLRRLTANRPKPMLPIGGKPLIQHTIEWLKALDITEIAVNLHHLPVAIPSYFGDGNRLGVNLHYSYEAELLGSAGAAKRLESFLDEPFVVIYGDVFTNLDLARLVQFHLARREQAACMTLALYRVPDPSQCGIVELDAGGNITRFVEKPKPHQTFGRLAFAGVLVCTPQVLEHIPTGQPYDFGFDLIPQLLSAGRSLLGQPVAQDEYVVDIGTLGGYLRALEINAHARLKWDAALLSQPAVV